MAAVNVVDGQSQAHNINVDTLSDGSQTQVVKLQIGSVGSDGGLVDDSNALPVMLSAFFKRLFQVFARFRFSTSSALVVDVNSSNIGTVSTVTTCSTVTNMTTGNIGIGDSGKQSTLISFSMNTFANSIGKNFTRS